MAYSASIHKNLSDLNSTVTTELSFNNSSQEIKTAPQFLAAASNIMEQRGKQYDKPEGERSMGKCVAAFNIITGLSLTESQGWLLLQVLKDVRLFQNSGFHQDSAEDCIAYAALKAEAKQKEPK